MKVLGIQRDERFSPNSVEKDKAILQAVLAPLGGRMVKESCLKAEDLTACDFVLNMGRLSETLALLKAERNRYGKIVNEAEAIAHCQRSRLTALMQAHHIPMPPTEGTKGYWVKRGDAAAQEKSDVCYCENAEALARQKALFAERGITDIVVQAHIEGDLVKFYGVEGSGFFFTCYPTDDGETKFGDELRNGKSHHYLYNKEQLIADAEQLAQRTGVRVYGGDAIIDKEGHHYIIDFNDWPSFSRCRDEAAAAIRGLLKG